MIIFRGLFTCVAVLMAALVLFYVGVYAFAVINEFDKYGPSLTLPRCEHRVGYSDGLVDVVRYREYYYSEKSIKKFEKNRFFKEVGDEDVEMLKGYFEDYEGWVANTDFADKYAFSKSQIQAGDYFYVYTLEGRPIGQSFYRRYDSYDVYYVDVSEKTLYFIHQNI